MSGTPPWLRTKYSEFGVMALAVTRRWYKRQRLCLFILAKYLPLVVHHYKGTAASEAYQGVSPE
jgi:hypothetical protein